MLRNCVLLMAACVLVGLTVVPNASATSPGDSDVDDVRYVIANVMDRVVGDIHPGPDEGMDDDVDNADIGKVAGSFTGSTGTGMAYFDGDMDFDEDVDNADIGFVAGAFTGADAGNLTDSPDRANLIYDPATGNVKLDASEAGGEIIVSFQFETDEAFMHDNYQGPSGGTFGGLYKEVAEKVIADSDLGGFGFGGVHNLATSSRPGWNWSSWRPT